MAEKSLALKKDNLMSLLIVAYAIPTPQYIKLHQADEEKQLTKAESYCQEALKAINDLKKQPNESDADFASRKAGYICQHPRRPGDDPFGPRASSA